MINIHNGDVIAERARRSNIPGEHLAFRESLVTGPAAGDREARARWLSESYGHNILRARNDLLDQERALDAAAAEDEIVLWFEHDLFCLINLLYLLDRFSAHRRLTLVWHPTPIAFEEDLMLLFRSRAAVTPSMLNLARSAWRAFTDSDPTSLNRLIRSEAPEFPFLRDSLLLHAQRFPSTLNGLGFVEARVLRLIANGAGDFVSLMQVFDDPPRLGFGDAELLRIVRALANRSVPLLTITEEEGTPPKALFALTPAAENVMSGEVDYLSVSDPDEWLGGVHVTRENLWLWDDDRREILSNRSAG